MTSQQLPGLEPGFSRVELELDDDGTWSVHVWRAQGRRFVSRTGYEVFERLTRDEALDVACSSL